MKATVEHRGVEVLQKLDCYQRTTFHYSVLSIHSVSLMSYILAESSGNIDIDAQDSQGKSSLHVSMISGNLCSTKKL